MENLLILNLTVNYMCSSLASRRWNNKVPASVVRPRRRCAAALPRGDQRGHCSDPGVGAPVSARETVSMRPILISNDMLVLHTLQHLLLALWVYEPVINSHTARRIAYQRAVTCLLIASINQ